MMQNLIKNLMEKESQESGGVQGAGVGTPGVPPPPAASSGPDLAAAVARLGERVDGLAGQVASLTTANAVLLSEQSSLQRKVAALHDANARLTADQANLQVGAR